MPQDMDGVVNRPFHAYSLSRRTQQAIQFPAVLMAFFFFQRVLVHHLESGDLSISEISVFVMHPLLQDIGAIAVTVLTRNHFWGHPVLVCTLSVCSVKQQGKDDTGVAAHGSKMQRCRTRRAVDNYRGIVTAMFVGRVAARESNTQRSAGR